MNNNKQTIIPELKVPFYGAFFYRQQLWQLHFYKRLSGYRLYLPPFSRQDTGSIRAGGRE